MTLRPSTIEASRFAEPWATAVLKTVVAPDGQVWASLRRMCEVLGIDAWGQMRRLAGESWATVVEMTMTAADGKNYDTACISLDALPMWLADIDSRRVASDSRPALIRQGGDP